MFDTPILDVDITNPGTSAVSYTLSVPTGIIVRAKFNQIVWSGDAQGVAPAYFSSLNNADVAPSNTAAPLVSAFATSRVYDSGSRCTGGPLVIETNTANQIRYRTTLSDANSGVKIAILGWTQAL